MTGMCATILDELMIDESLGLGLGLSRHGNCKVGINRACCSPNAQAHLIASIAIALPLKCSLDLIHHLCTPTL